MSLPPSSAHVQVLLATFNGGRFLRQQIDSILAQTYQPLTILARDDGSSDETIAILDEYATRYPARFSLMPQTAPSGSAQGNFVRLLAASAAEFLACADQDDVWLPDKIALSMATMQRLVQRHGKATPLLVFTNLAVVNEYLQILQPSFWRYQHIAPKNARRLRRLLTQNVVTGSTILMNRRLGELATRMSDRAGMHDWWIALIACACGAADFLPKATVLYRQHGLNIVGAVGLGGVNGFPSWRYHEKRREKWESTVRQAQAFYATYREELPPRSRRILEAYLRCETSESAMTRTSTMVRYGFFFNQPRITLAILWYLWDMKAAKRDNPH